MDLKIPLANSSQYRSLRFFIDDDDDDDDDDDVDDGVDDDDDEEEDGPEDTSSKLLSIPFTEVFLHCDDDAMLRGGESVKQTKTDEIRLRLLAFLK